MALDNAVSQPMTASPDPVRVPLWLIAMITFSGTLAMHIFVPALPLAAMDFGTSPASLQLTISVYILGLAAGQLFYGPVSDRYGRRPVLMVGLVLYTISGLAAALAPSVHALIVARLFQAVGGCAGLVLGRAIVRDGTEVSAAAKRLALMNLMTTIGPGLAPLAGGFLATTLGWRSIFFAVTALGAANLLFAWRILPETGGAALAHDARTIMRNYGKLLVSPAFLGYAVGGGCSTTAMYAFLTAAPFIFVNQLHRPSGEVGIYLAILIGGVWLGSALYSRLAGRIALDRSLIISSLIGLVGTGLLLAVVLTGHMTVLTVMSCMMLVTFATGMTSPPALVKSMSVNPLVIGSASGLYGFIQMLIGAICTALAGIGSDHALSAAIVLVVSALVGQIALWVAIRVSALDGFRNRTGMIG